jgi:hypothetical protein
MMKNISVKQLKDYLSEIDDGNVPVKIFSSFNQFNIKRVALYNGTVILEVGEVENPLEEYVDDSPQIA